MCVQPHHKSVIMSSTILQSRGSTPRRCFYMRFLGTHDKPKISLSSWRGRDHASSHTRYKHIHKTTNVISMANQSSRNIKMKKGKNRICGFRVERCVWSQMKCKIRDVSHQRWTVECEASNWVVDIIPIAAYKCALHCFLFISDCDGTCSTTACFYIRLAQELYYISVAHIHSAQSQEAHLFKGHRVIPAFCI